MHKDDDDDDAHTGVSTQGHAASAECDEHDGYAYLLQPAPQYELVPNLPQPPSDQIYPLWRIFKQRVDPLTKVIHVPSVFPTIDQAIINTAARTRPQSALLCAICSTAVLSITNEESKSMFGDEKESLLRRYIALTKTALSRANFLESTDLTTLQALVLHVFSVRSTYSPRAMWTLNGIASRVAQTMRLDRDGTSLGLSAFQIELRRRIWWAIKGNDMQIAELCGLDKFQSFADLGPDTTRVPSDIGDDEMRPNMSHLSTPNPERGTVSDGVFIALRGELNRFAMRKVNSARTQSRVPHLDELPGAEKFASIEALRQTLEERFIRPCDPSQPLQLLTMLVARTTLVYVEFMMRHPRQWKRHDGGNKTEPTAEERSLVWSLTIRLLEHYVMTQTNSSLVIFKWHTTHFVWHAIIHVLNELRVQPMHVEADRAWELVEKVFSLNVDLTTNARRPIEVAVGQLCLRAYDVKKVGMTSSFPSRHDKDPVYIQNLRTLASKVDHDKQRRAGPPCRDRTHADDYSDLDLQLIEPRRTTTRSDAPGISQAANVATERFDPNASSVPAFSTLLDGDNKLFLD